MSSSWACNLTSSAIHRTAQQKCVGSWDLTNYKSFSVLTPSIQISQVAESMSATFFNILHMSTNSRNWSYPSYLSRSKPLPFFWGWIYFWALRRNLLVDEESHSSINLWEVFSGHWMASLFIIVFSFLRNNRVRNLLLLSLCSRKKTDLCIWNPTDLIQNRIRIRSGLISCLLYNSLAILHKRWRMVAAQEDTKELWEKHRAKREIKGLCAFPSETVRGLLCCELHLALPQLCNWGSTASASCSCKYWVHDSVSHINPGLRFNSWEGVLVN